MKTTLTALTLLCILMQTVNISQAVDSRRVGTQVKSAPDWVHSANNFNDPSNGLNTAIGPAVRDRASLSGAQPGWSSSSLPANDPLRNNWNDNFYNSTEPDQPHTLQRWRLGIYPENTDTGVLLTEIVRGSAAERAGLEVNDRIISVHGYQVGYVDGTLYDSGQEFERHADDQGWVRLLVQNNRDGKLLSIPVQLEAKQKEITGTAAYRGRSTLPRDAMLTVELREVFQRGIQPVTIAQQTYNVGRQVPIPFTLQYDSSQVDNRHLYVLHANISAAGRQLYRSQQDIPVLGNSSSSNLQVLLESTNISPGGDPLRNRNDELGQIAQWFRDYLGREPRAQEKYVWEAHLARGGSLSDAQLQILSTPEFYYQSNADDTLYVQRMFHLVANRRPSQQEISQWLNRLQYHNRMRPEMAREFLAMANQQTRR